jgi:hypothetical protein
MADPSPEHDARLRDAIMAVARAFNTEITPSRNVWHLVSGVMGVASRRAFIDRFRDQPLISLHQRLVLAAFLEILGEETGRPTLREAGLLVGNDVVFQAAAHWADAYASGDQESEEERVAHANRRCLSMLEVVPVPPVPEVDEGVARRAALQVRQFQGQALAGVRARWDELMRRR